MATFIRKKGDKAFYAVLDRGCIGRECLRIHLVEKRGTYMDGSSRLVDRVSCCARREGFGYPDPTPEFDKELAKKAAVTACATKKCVPATRHIASSTDQTFRYFSPRSTGRLVA